MKKQINNNNNNYYESNYSYFSSIEKNLNFYLLKDCYLTLNFEDLNLNKYKSVSVFFKNIKTREIIKCISSIENNNLIINLKDLDKLCTDYEFSIIIILDDYSYSTAIYPVLKVNNNLVESYISSCSNSNIQWFLRILDNGKLRLSTIYVFSALEKTNDSKILL